MEGSPFKTAYDVMNNWGANHGAISYGHIERFKFYDEAKKAYAVIATGETALYANIILQKGVVK